jgi:hypothetical protein
MRHNIKKQSSAGRSGPEFHASNIEFDGNREKMIE